MKNPHQEEGHWQPKAKESWQKSNLRMHVPKRVVILFCYPCSLSRNSLGVGSARTGPTNCSFCLSLLSCLRTLKEADTFLLFSTNRLTNLSFLPDAWLTYPAQHSWKTIEERAFIGIFYSYRLGFLTLIRTRPRLLIKP